MSEAGAVAWQFQKKGLVAIEKGKVDEDTLLSLALDAGAEDVKVGEKSYEVLTNTHDFEAVKKALADAKIDTTLAEITYIPQNTIRLEEKSAEQMLKLMEILDEHDDVQKVHANFDIPDDVMEKVAATGEVRVFLRAWSRPGHWLVRLFTPLARHSWRMNCVTNNPSSTSGC